MVGVELLLDAPAESQVPLRPVRAALRRARPPLLLGRDVGHSAPGAQVHLVVAVGESRPGDDAGDADDDRARAAALAEVHVGLPLGPRSAERVVAALGQAWDQRAGGHATGETLRRVPVPYVVHAERLP